MYDKNAAELIGTITDTPRYKKTENTGRSKVDFVMKIHRQKPANSYDRVYVTAWEDLADQIHDSYNEGDRISVKGKINVSSYKDKEGDQYHFFTRVIAEDAKVPDEKKGQGFGYVKVVEESEEAKVL